MISNTIRETPRSWPQLVSPRRPPTALSVPQSASRASDCVPTRHLQIGDIQCQLERDAVGSNGTVEFRTRYANIRIGAQWLISRYWTNFQPRDTYPTPVEFNAPVGVTYAHMPQVHYTYTIGPGTFLAVSVKENFGGQNLDDPMLTSSIAYNDGKYVARAAALYGRAQSGNVEVDQDGFVRSGSKRPWQGSLFQVNYVNGEAFGSCLIGLDDAVRSGQTNDVDGYAIDLRQDWSSRRNVSIAYSKKDCNQLTSTDSRSFTELETIHVNARYKATDNLTLSAEYIHGTRNDTTSGGIFDGNRIQFAAQLNVWPTQYTLPGRGHGHTVMT